MSVSARLGLTQELAKHLYPNQWGTPERGERTLRAPKKAPRVPWSVLLSCKVTEESFGADSDNPGGFPCFTVVKKGASPRGAVLYLEGGGNVLGMDGAQWEMVRRLAMQDHRVVVPLGALAPKFKFHHTHALHRAVYDQLCQTMDPSEIVVAGFSAGGGHAVTLVQGLPMGLRPAHMVLAAPMTDLNLKSLSVKALDKVAPILQSPGLEAASISWEGGVGHSDPRVSPINGDLSGLPSMTVIVGGLDVLHHSVMEFVYRVREHGGNVYLHEVPGACHGFQLMWWTPEGQAAHAEMNAAIGLNSPA